MKQIPRIKLADTVVLIDAAYLNLVIMDIQGYYEEKLQRDLQEIDLSRLALYLMLDTGIERGEHKVQFVFVYDKEASRIVHSNPSDMRNELDGVAFQCSYGEYMFACVCAEDIVPREDLFMDLLTVVAGSDSVKKLVVMPFNELYGDRVSEVLDEVEGKEIFLFHMVEPENLLKYKSGSPLFPVMQALGISADDLR